MGQLIVRNLDDELVVALKRRAARHGRSAEAEHRAILREVLAADAEKPSFKAFLANMPDVGTDERTLPAIALAGVVPRRRPCGCGRPPAYGGRRVLAAAPRRLRSPAAALAAVAPASVGNPRCGRSTA